MIFLGPLVSSFILGFLILANLLKNSRLPNRAMFLLILAAPVGLGTCSIAMFWAYVAAASHGKWLSFVLIGLLGAYLLIRLVLKSKSKAVQQNFLHLDLPWLKKKPDKAALLYALLSAAALILFCYIFGRFVRNFISASCWEIFGGWDARFIWNLKAKFFFRSPAEWTGMFRQELSFSHPDYPLLLPGAIAWAWNWAGKEILIWPPLVAFLFTACTGLLILWYLFSYVALWSGLVACSYFFIIGAYQFWSATQYADIPVCFFMTASAVALLAAIRAKDSSDRPRVAAQSSSPGPSARERPLFFLAGLLAGMAAWTKNEGLFFAAWSVLILAGVLFMNPMSWPDKKTLACSFIGGLGIPLLNVFYLKIIMAKTGDYLGSGRTASEYFSLVLGSGAKTQVILNGFQTYMTKFDDWNGLWILFFCALLVGLSIKRKEILENSAWIPAAAAILIELGYFAVMHASPHEIHWQIETALLRLLLHAGALALIFSFEVFSPSSRPETETHP